MPLLETFANTSARGYGAFLPSAAGFAYEQIATQLVGSSSASITFSGIPTIYKHLQIRFTCKTSSASSPISIAMWFNGDTGANYSSHWIFGEGSGAYADNNAPGNQINLHNASISSQDNRYGAGVVDVADYSSVSKNKTAKSLHGVFGNGTAGESCISLSGGSWRNTAAISSISFASTGGGSRTIESGSRFSLYGIRG
jgi:hypothetical protein